MIFKRCTRCGKRIPSGSKCPCLIENPIKRDYSNNKRSRKEYHGGRWQKLRNYVMARHNYLDAFALEERGEVIPADTVHHIIPTKDDETLFFEASNLIPVSKATHEYIHSVYDHDADSKKKLQHILRSIVFKYQKNFSDESMVGGC